jgi:hypothetical protein
MCRRRLPPPPPVEDLTDHAVEIADEDSERLVLEDLAVALERRYSCAD